MGTLLLLGAGTFSGPASAPVNTSAPVISGTNVVGNVLTTTNGTWTGSPSPTFTYWWKRNGVPVVPFPTPGATTYNLIFVDAGCTITCEVYATNPSGTASATSNSLYVYDADAYAYNTATTLTATTQTVALNEFVLDLKGANIWTKFNALYPMITDKVTQVDIANQMKFNLKNPVDSNGAFRLSYPSGIGSITFSSNGMAGNGTNGYADTFLSPSSTLSNGNTHISIYSRTNSASGVGDIGVVTGTGGNGYLSINLRWSDGNLYSDQYNFNTNRITIGNANSEGFYIGTRTTTNLFKVFKNGTQFGTTNTNVSTPNTSTITNTIFIANLNVNGSPASGNYSQRQYSFASIGSGLTDLESQLFYQIVEKYQVALSRNINPTQSFYYNRNYGNETNAYLFATQITNTSTQVAIGTFIGQLKSYNIWTKMKAIYPMITDKTLQVDMANQIKYNLVNPQDTNNAFRLSWVGGWNYSTNGATPNGTNAYANTFLSTSAIGLNSGHLSYYSRTNFLSAGSAADIGTLKPSPDSYSDLALSSANTIFFRFNNTVTLNSVATSNTQGFYVGTRTASNVIKTFKNGVNIINGTAPSSATSTVPFFIGASNNNGTPQYYSTKQSAFASIGDGLTDTEASNFYTAVQNLQTTLGRAILPTPPIVSDPDAQAFINSANIVDQVEATAVNNLVIGLKADGLWTSMKAIYPMVGSSASSCAVNLKTVGTYNLSFVGGWTFSQNGALPNGSNAYADTFLAPSTAFVATDNKHLSFYSRTNSATAGFSSSIGSDSGGGSPNYCRFTIRQSSNGRSSIYGGTNGTAIATAETDSRGFYQSSRINATSSAFYKNGSNIANGTSTNGTTSQITQTLLISASRSGASIVYYDNKECAFASIGDSLDAVQTLNFYNRVQAFQTTLNRQV